MTLVHKLSIIYRCFLCIGIGMSIFWFFWDVWENAYSPFSALQHALILPYNSSCSWLFNDGCCTLYIPWTEIGIYVRLVFHAGGTLQSHVTDVCARYCCCSQLFARDVRNRFFYFSSVFWKTWIRLGVSFVRFSFRKMSQFGYCSYLLHV